MKRFAIFALLCIGLFGCSREHLFVQSDYMTHDYLASTFVGSPDPMKDQDWIGQRLIVGWSVPKEYLEKRDIRLDLVLRYRNREEAIISFPLVERSGKYVYRLLKDDYREKRGLLTYQARIVAGENEILDKWTHQIWADILDVEIAQ